MDFRKCEEGDRCRLIATGMGDIADVGLIYQRLKKFRDIWNRVPQGSI